MWILGIIILGIVWMMIKGKMQDDFAENQHDLKQDNKK